MNPILDRLRRGRVLIGMVHLGALPGTPRAEFHPETIAEHAAREALLLEDAGFDAVLIENMHDRPYLRRRVGPEVIAAFARAAFEVRQAISLPIGVQVLAGDNHAALAIAHAAGACFVRAEGFAYASVADEGLLARADAGPLLRFRRAIGATGVAIFADVRKKHAAHAITQDLDLAEEARGHLFCGADGLIVTGPATAVPAAGEDVRRVAEAAGDAPVLVGSGVTPDSFRRIVPPACGAIVGSALKVDGGWMNAMDPARVQAFVTARDRA